MAECAEFPVEHGDDARLSRVNDRVPQPVVAVVDAGLVAGRDICRQPLLEVFHRRQVVRARQVVLARPAGDLALDVLALAAVIAEADLSVVDIVQAGQHVVHRIEDLAAVGGRHGLHPVVGEDAAGQEFHDVEGGADHAVVLTERVGPGHRHVGMVRQGLDHAVLSVDLMGRRQQFARRLLAQHVHAPATVSQMKGRIALPALELEDFQGGAEAFHVGLHVVGQSRLIEDVGFANGSEVCGQFGHRRGNGVSFTGRAVLASLRGFFEG